jgi:hypothetical protein
VGSEASNPRQHARSALPGLLLIAPIHPQIRTKHGHSPTAEEENLMPRNALLPEIAPKKIQILHDAAEEYFAAHERKCDASEAEKQARETLIRRMRKQGIPSYCHSGLVIVIEEQDKLQIKQYSQSEQKAAEAGK